MSISNRPYLIRAMIDWIVDNDWTPHFQVDANYPGILIPREFVEDDMIMLNIHPDAIREGSFTNEWFGFKTRFQGVEQQLGFPPDAVLAVYARENGEGLPFPKVDYPDVAPVPPTVVSDDTKQAAKPAKKKSHLSIVK